MWLQPLFTTGALPPKKRAQSCFFYRQKAKTKNKGAN